jgi:hypothetical protein
MGNRWTTSEREYINERVHPHLDVFPLPSGEFDYRPSVGRHVTVRIQQTLREEKPTQERGLLYRLIYGDGSVQFIVPEDRHERRTLAEYETELIPPLEPGYPAVQPPEYHIPTVAHAAVQALWDNTLRQALHSYPSANRMEVLNGLAWNSYPARYLAAIMRSEYTVSQGVALQGRSKRKHVYVFKFSQR